MKETTTIRFEHETNDVDSKDTGDAMVQKTVKRQTRNGTTVIMHQNARKIINIEHLDTLTL